MRKGLIFAFIIAGFTCWMASCGSTHKNAKKQFNISKKIVDANSTPAPIQVESPIRDSVPAPQKMTPGEYRSYLQKFYKDNFDAMFKPEFMRLSATIQAQAESIQRLTDLVGNVRERSIRKTDSMRDINNMQQAQLLAYQRGTYLRQQEAVKQNKLQIGDLNSLIHIILIMGAVLWAGMIGLFIYNKIQFKRMTKLYNSVADD